MDYFRKACLDMLEELKKQDVKSQKELNSIKLKILHRYKAEGKIKTIPKNADILFAADEETRKKYKDILSLKPVRTISGVSPIALMSDPYPCPHTMKGIGPCTYCPGGPGSSFGDTPQSYTGKEPSTRRSMRNFYDPYLIVFNRLEHYVAMGKIPDKAEIIIQGGTFTFFPKIYQEYFIKYALKAMNDFSRLFFVDGELDNQKFKKFFELPRKIAEEDFRTQNVQKKLNFVKYLDLSNLNDLEKAEIFFKDNFNNFLSNEDSFVNGEKVNGQNNPKDNISNSASPMTNETNNKDSINNINNPIISNIKHSKNEEIPIIKTNSINSNKKSTDFSSPINNNFLKNENNSEATIMNPDGTVQILDKKLKNPNTLAMKNIHNKMSQLNDSSLTLKQIQKDNETSMIRCVGLTIETKSDFGKLYHGNLMLELGCTRVEIGIQSIYNEVLEATNRGNTVQDNIESLRILKDLAFKINCHYMPGLPLTTKDMDIKGLKELFKNPDYMPDMLKIYPCMVLEGTKLYDDYKAGKFIPLSTKEAAEIIAEAKKYVPKWARIMRVQRDIPTYVTEAGVDKTNLRQYVEKICKEKGIKCKCIRCREAGFKKADFAQAQMTIEEYGSSGGKEFFLAYEDLLNDALFGYIRMRFPGQFLRKEITKNCALIRELHIYSAAVQIGKKSDESFQHRGLGKQLLAKAEEIARKKGKDKMVVISAIGTREYFRKFGYELEGPYMVKRI